METTVDIAAYEALQAENQVLLWRVEAAEQREADVREQLALVVHELAQLKRLIFGTKSERFMPAGGPDQLPLFEAAPSQAPPEEPPAAPSLPSARARKKPVRQVLPSHLPREVIGTKGPRPIRSA